ncbi:uncharacterized protein [Nicotiana tomentosiformis]|uniref:uncharacterized protein n=1 Tax=Nicotiana tomentosiformis TaxID=4098 RepID=UPI00388CAF4D
MGPMQQSRKLDRYRRHIGFAQAFVSISNKIWAFIDEKYDVTVEINSVQQLTLRLVDTEEQKEFMLTLIYAKCDAIERIELWDSLGDFNFIWDEEEKFGGLPVSLNEVDEFRHCMNTCNLTDLGFKGSIYTWWNRRAEEDCIFKRLDRCFANIELQQMWPGVDVTHLPKIGSDHCPILITCNPDAADFYANPFVLFNHKLKKLKKSLTTWSSVTYGDIFQRISSLEEVVRVHEAQFELSPTLQNRERLQKVQAELFRYLALEEQFWKKKSGMTWFNEGDRNTKFFHAHINGKRKRLQLKRIQNSEGIWIEDIARMTEEAMNAGGPDGFNGHFFHTCWDIIGVDVVEMVKAFLYGQELSRFITHTNLVLLPKKKEIKTFSDMRSISLSNFINKVFSRVIHERLVSLLPNLISDEQAGFVKGRSIVENVLLTQEIVTDIRLRTKAGPNIIIKLDMTKAYDRLSWIFLTKILRRMGFDERFIGLVFGTISNNWYSVLLTGQPH